MEMRIIKQPILRAELGEITKKTLGDFVKAVVDIEQGIMAVGGEFHADEEVLLMEREGSKREHTWGINLRINVPEDQWIEFDSMVNLKPGFGNRTRGVENEATREKIKKIVYDLVKA